MAGSTSHPLITRAEDDRRLLGLALGIALGLHISVLLFVALPDAKAPMVAHEPRVEPPSITIFVPSPPPPERLPRPEREAAEPMLPIPDPVPERPEPIAQPVIEDVGHESPIDVRDLVGEPEELPSSAPLELTDRTIAPPTLIARSKIEPSYPELGRVSRVPGQVTLRAVIGEDGSVGEIEVVDCRPTGYGFEQAAIDAVMQWRYRPAIRHGVPVSVYLIVEVTFRLG